MTRMDAVDAILVISSAWISYRDRQIFRLLRNSVNAAENIPAIDLLKFIAPREGSFFSKDSHLLRIRFRFGGDCFPPLVYFKVYLGCLPSDSDKKKSNFTVQYFSGKNIVKGTAPEDALSQMGNRIYYDQLVQDSLTHHQFGISDHFDVASTKDYCQYMSCLDETPCYQGGKSNPWRRLDLVDLQRNILFYDIVEFVLSGRKSAQLQNEFEVLSRPTRSEQDRRENLRVIATPRENTVPAFRPERSPSALSTLQTSRRSRQARRKNRLMRKIYSTQAYESSASVKDFALEDGQDWEEEADMLFEWTQELTFDDNV